MKAGALDVRAVYLGDTEVQRMYLGAQKVYEVAGASFPDFDIGLSPDYAPLGGASPQLALTATNITPPGATVTAVDGDGNNIPASGAGNFVIAAAPAADETYAITATNSVNESVTKRAPFYRSSAPSWGTPTVTRQASGSGTTGSEIVTRFLLEAELVNYPFAPTITLTGDDWFLRAIRTHDLSHHLSPGRSDKHWRFSMSVYARKNFGATFSERLELRAANTKTGETADYSTTITA